MDFGSILITGGAGFVGSSLAVQIKRSHANVRVTALDNLTRRGSELNLPRLAAHGIDFVHGDIRCAADLAALSPADLIIDCAAEPSVQAGVNGSPKYVLDTNLVGTINCLETARHWDAAFVFLSTSRVYPIATLNNRPYREEDTRYCWENDASVSGFSLSGVAEDFPLAGARSYYGASKLAAELIIQEYVHTAGLRAIINRCGILTGPWQFGKVDQGVVTLWVARHYFQKPLKYIGFGGQGKQVRDLLHVDDLYDLMSRQMNDPSAWKGDIYNVGGGQDVSLSLVELTDVCRAITGHKPPIAAQPETSDVDLRIYISDTSKVQRTFQWQPRRNAESIVEDIHRWIDRESQLLAPILN